MTTFRALRNGAGWVCFALLASCSLIACAPSTTTPPAANSQHLIMISIDGMVPDYYTAPENSKLKAPVLTKLKTEGAYAEGVEGVYPTVTYPSHTTLVTGVKPAVHGIVQNRIFEAPSDPQTRAWYWYAKDLKTDTLWTAAKKAGLKTAALGWPASVGAEIDLNAPEIYEPGETPQTFKKINQNSTPGLIDKALGPGGSEQIYNDDRMTTVAEYIIKNEKPNLMVIHLIDLDGAHHRNGPRAPAAIEVAEKEDSYIGRIIEATKQAGTFDKTTFFVVSDHGFSKIESRVSPNVRLAKAGLITVGADGKATDWKAAAWPAGGSCAIILKDPNDKATEAKVKALFTAWANEPNSPIKQIVDRQALDALGSYPKALLALEGAAGYSFDDVATGPEVKSSGETYRGTHGYLPTNPELRSSLIIYGANAKPGVHVGLARMIDIAPTAASLLKLSLPQAEGKPIANLVK